MCYIPQNKLDVFELAHQVPIVETISAYMPLQYKNGKYYGLCPFHNDKSVGSFVVFPDESSNKRGGFQCYSCGAKGDNIDFVREYLNIGYRDAAIAIAENAGLIGHDDADALRRNSAANITPIQRNVRREQIVLAKKKDSVHLDKVYRCFAAAAFALSPLSSETKQVLLNSRKIPESSLWKYFLFPTRNELPTFWNQFCQLLSAEFDVENQQALADLLIGVPGFYVGKNQRVAFSTASERQMGIITLNRNGLVSGIQTRDLKSLDGVVHSKEEKRSRYKFLSSGYANGTPHSAGTHGCSCGFVEDILYPKKGGGWNRAVAVTEGRFKAETLAALGFLVVNMHSISNWKAAGKTALEVSNAAHAKQFVLCYDSEKNADVVRSASNLYEQLSPSLLTEFAVWDPSLGKGIDDVINAGYIKEISRVPAPKYFERKTAA